ncbi:hypothetical protein K239x_11950 [Planctomycetes bacterium K23_9]|uniref:DUF418 domain-containing protein n=2 Tax=Stieleria marina TaxID=1930275 RepID=A0A517NQ56_9BACT|nr:hypothetical protein K239x_11950 [Planctomycetes bacterium K23_9]
MNIQAFSMIGAAYLNPVATPELAAQMTGLNYVVWYIGHVFFDAKFMSQFSILFGAGILLMAQRCEATGRSPAGVHYRRLLGLLVFGLIHAYFFWSGDILVTYALCGAVLYPFWRCRNRVRLATAGCLFLMGSLIISLTGLSMPYWPESELISMKQEMWQPSTEMVDAEIEAYSGPWWNQFLDRARMTFEFQIVGIPMLLFWQVTALMLIGMTLLETGVLTGKLSKRLYAIITLLGFGVGLPLVIWGLHQNESHDWDMQYSILLGTQFNYFGSLLMAMGYIGFWGLILKSATGQKLGRLLAPVGRMALTNYLMQTLICTTIFYGHGFGYFMSIQRSGQALIVVAIWCFQIVFSHCWLQRHRFGPAESVWRVMTYGKPTR